MPEKFNDLHSEELRKYKTIVPEGQYEAWAKPDVKIDRKNIENIWDEQIIESYENGLINKEDVAGCKQSVLTMLNRLAGPREYFSLEGYGDFEKRLFNKSHWIVFNQEFPQIAPFLEILRKQVHAIMRMEFQPEIIQAIERYLQEAQYPDWNPNFFKRHRDNDARSLHTWVRNHIQGINGRPKWTMVVDRLSREAQEKFSTREGYEKIQDKDIIAHLEKILDNIIVIYGYWTPNLVQYEWKTLYMKLTKKYRSPSLRPDIGDISEDATRPNWHEILLELPDQYRKKFRWGFGRAFRYRTEEDGVREIAEILTQWQPQNWGPHWLEENGFWAIRQYWENHFRDETGKIDWHRLINQLPDNLREGFTTFQ